MFNIKVVKYYNRKEKMGTIVFKVEQDSDIKTEELKKALLEYPTVGKFYQYNLCDYCKDCFNNPYNNPNATGICNCILPYMGKIT